jgi:hypothetical protein
LPEAAPDTANDIAPQIAAALGGVGAGVNGIRPGDKHDEIPSLASFDQPLTLADVLDGSFEIMKARPRAVFLLAASVLLPVAVAVVLVDPSLLGGDALAALTDSSTYEDGAARTDSNFGVSILATLVSSFQVTLLAAPLAVMVEGWSRGRDIGPWKAVKRVGSGWVWLVIAFVLTHMAQAVGAVLLVLPAVALMALFSVTAPALAVEHLSAGRSIGRSWQLVKVRFFPTLWVNLLSAVIAGTLSFLLALLPLAIVELFGLGGEQYAAALGSVGAGLVALPFTAGVAVMLYFDLRIRVEGFDLDLALDRHFATDDVPVR